MKASKGLLLVLMLGMAAGCGSSADSAADYVESGNEFFDNGNYDKARLEYKNAIQIDPRQAEPYYRLALLDEQSKNWKQMFANLTTVEQLDPNHVDAQIKLGRLYLLGGKLDEAMTRADKALSLKPESFDGRILKASILAKEQKFDQASKLLAEVAKDYPDHKDILSLEVLILKDKGQLPAALAKAQEAVEKYPEDLSLRLIELSLYNEMKDYKGMANVYEEILERKPDEREVVLSYAKLLVSQLDRYDDALNILQSFLKIHPDDAEAQQFLLGLINQKNPQEALTKLDEMIKAAPENYDLRFAKAALLDKNGDVDGSVSELNRIVEEDPQGINGNKARVMLASYYASKQDFNKARELAQAVLDVAPEESGALLVRAKLDLIDQKYDQAVTDLRTVLRNSPDSDEAMILLAQAYQKQGSEALAEDSFRQALAANPYNATAALTVSSMLVQESNYDKAEQVLVTALDKNPTNATLLQQLTEVRILKKDWKAGIETIDLLKDQQGDTLLSHLLSGQLYEGQGDYALAKAEYEAALELEPNSSRAMQGLATSMEALDENEQLESYLNNFNQKYPNSMNGYATLAIHYFRGDKAEQAVSILEKKIAEQKNWTLGYSLLTDYYLRNDKLNDAAKVLKQAVDNIDDNIRFSLQLASIEESRGNYGEARNLYDAILKKNNNVDIAANNLASLLTDRFESPENLNRALEITQRFKSSTQPYFLDSYGWVNVKLNKLDEAKPVLEQAVSLEPNVAVFNYHLGVLHAKQGNNDLARQYLNTAKQQASQDNDSTLMADIDTALSTLDN